MTMHLEGPWLSTTGKKKSKRKFASAEQARRARELDAEWQAMQAEWAKVKPFSNSKAPAKTKALTPVVSGTHVRDTGPKIPSKKDTVLGPVAGKAKMCYTGDKMLGIGTMHKSNSVPIFSSEEAVSISSMRR